MKKIKVLVVEDDPIMAFLHNEQVKKRGISSDPLTFKNGKEALNFILLDTWGDCSFMILLDLNMPVMNGWEFLDELEEKRIADRTKVAIVTSSIDQADMKKAAQYETVVSYLPKPLLDLSPILEAVETLRQ